MSDFAVITPAQATRLLKNLGKARNAIDIIGMQLNAIGVTKLSSISKPKTKKQPRKVKAKKVGTEAPKATKPTDPLTA